jgi:hypothetical protein
MHGEQQRMQRHVQHVEQSLSGWYQSLENPAVTQHIKMMELLEIYSETELGQRSNADSIETYNKFREYLPLSSYESLTPYLNSLYQGEYNILMADPPRAWALSRATTGSAQKTIPLTPRDLQDRVQAWPRALFSYIRKTGRYDILDGIMVNLSLPSNVKLVQMGPQQLPAGYASGMVALAGSDRFGIRLVPKPSELEKLQPKLNRSNLRKRFQFIMLGIKTAPVTALWGNVDMLLNFGRFIKSRYRKPPKRIWHVSALVCSGSAGIHSRYKLALRDLYGDCIILENYETAEGTFAQQMDESPSIVPNYDLYFFEVNTKIGPKPLYSMLPGEVGGLVVSTSVLPRMKMGDNVKCIAPNKFQIVGRDSGLGKLGGFSKKTPGAEDKDIW